jgi:hypothetical protein
MSFAEMFRHLQPIFRGENLENAAELAGFWRLASADEAHRRDLLVEHLKEKARSGQLDRLFPFEVEALIKEIPSSLHKNGKIADFVRAKYSFLSEKFVQQLAAECLTRKRRSE